MKTIDQRILIPVTPQVIWEYISDINNNTQWQVDYRNISFLSSRRSGPNVRWRYSDDKKREFVVETTAWYDGMGYEYTFVDGVPYKECTGRIRLQEIPEGTVVQWTFTYQYGGILGFLRHMFESGRHIENTMVESLRNLWKQLSPKESKRSIGESKAVIREGLSYEARVQYKPRHPSNKKEQKAAPSMINPLKEPPITDEDTRPNHPVTAPEAVADAPPSSASEDAFDFPEIEFDDLSSSVSKTSASLDELFSEDMQRFAPPPSDERFTTPNITFPEAPSEPDFLADIPNPSALAQAHETGTLESVSDFDFSIGTPPQAADIPLEKQSVDDFASSDQPSDLIFNAETNAFDDEMVELFGPPQHKTSTQIAARIEPTESQTAAEMTDNGEVPSQPEVSPKTATQPMMHVDIPDIDSPSAPINDKDAEQPIDTPTLKTATQPIQRFDFPEEELTKAEDEVTPPTSADEMSIWEIFGLPRPSETQEHQAVPAESPAVEQRETVETKTQPVETATTPPAPLPEVVASAPFDVPSELDVEEHTSPDISVQPLHEQPVGFRITMRRKRVKLRRR